MSNTLIEIPTSRRVEDKAARVNGIDWTLAKLLELSPACRKSPRRALYNLGELGILEQELPEFVKKMNGEDKSILWNNEERRKDLSESLSDILSSNKRHLELRGINEEQIKQTNQKIFDVLVREIFDQKELASDYCKN